MPSPALFATVVDTVRTALAAAWPRSTVRQEIDRLREEGHVEGESCEMAFSVSFDDAITAAGALPALRAVADTVDVTQARRGFLTARATVLVTPLELARAVTRLERSVRASGGFVAVIGPTKPSSQDSTSWTPTRGTDVRDRVRAVSVSA